MSRLLYRVGHTCAAHPWRTVAAWLCVLVVAVTLAVSFGGTPQDDYRVPGTSSQRGADLLGELFPAVSGTDARVVLHDDAGEPLSPALLDEVRSRLAAMDGVGAVGPPRPSADGDTALLSVSYRVPVTEFTGTEGVDALAAAAEPAAAAGLRVEFGGQVPESVIPKGGLAESIGVLAALVILLLAFGSVLAAGLPLAVAAVGLGIGMSAIMLLAAVGDVSTSAPTIASMVGIGVGIDYALLLVTRHTEGLRSGLSTVDAAARANATAGLSVLFAGATVLLSLVGLQFSGLPLFTSFGTATSLVVAAVVGTSITLVPALCGLAGYRLLGRQQRVQGGRHRLPARHERRAWAATQRILSAKPAIARWAAKVGQRPLPWALGALLVMVILAAPIAGMRTWPLDAGSQPDTNTVRRAYDLVAAEYGAGANGPLIVAVDLRRVDRNRIATLVRDLTVVTGVAHVAPPVFSPAGSGAVIVLEPAWGPQDERATELVEALRTDVLPSGAEVTGVTAGYADSSALLAARLWLVIGIVIGCSLVLLTVVFRSILVPLKAAIVNLLSIGAAYGVLVAVFQGGWGASLLGIDHPVLVVSGMPLLMFSVLFGLSMDYEVFLMSRIREDYQATGDATGSVVRGLAATGPVITSAAVIMVAVFVGFGLDTDITVKMMGVGMSVAIALDATVIRLVLVPATMALLGDAAWWLPRRLDRVLPAVDVHGPARPQRPRVVHVQVGDHCVGRTGPSHPVGCARNSLP